MDCFASLAMTADIVSHSRDAMRPSYGRNPCPRYSEGAGNAGCALHPRSRAQWVEECAHEHTGQRRQSDIPCAMALRLITCSPRRTALLPPSLSGLTANLTPAPRRQDHTSSPYASAPFVKSASASTATRPTFVTWPTPLFPGRDGDRYAPDLPSGKAKYF